MSLEGRATRSVKLLWKGGFFSSVGGWLKDEPPQFLKRPRGTIDKKKRGERVGQRALAGSPN